MPTVTVKTNNRIRHTFYAFEYSGDVDALRQKYDWMTDDDFDCAAFFKYRGEVYAFAEFMRVTYSDMSEWQGILTETAYSGLVIRSPYAGAVVVGRYYD